MLARQPSRSMFVCSLMTPLAMFMLGPGPQVDAPDSEVPTSIERALIERACSVTNRLPSTDNDAHQQCLHARLLSLRTDFGRDLNRLSAANRKNIDAVCARLRPAERREAYLDCLGDQLGALRMRQNRGGPASVEETTVAPSQQAVAPSASAAPVRQASLWPSATVIGGSVGSAITVAGVILLAVRSRRARRTCRICGADVPDSDLCTTCRHEAAEALRRAVLERAHDQRAQEEEARQRECEAEQREQKARDEKEAHAREQALANQREEAARQQPAEEDDRQRHAVVVPTAPEVEEEAFDPYVVLGIPREASQEDICAAYQQATTKFDPGFVMFLGHEARAHFEAKAQAAERAYQMLSEGHPSLEDPSLLS